MALPLSKGGAAKGAGCHRAIGQNDARGRGIEESKSFFHREIPRHKDFCLFLSNDFFMFGQKNCLGFFFFRTGYVILKKRKKSGGLPGLSSNGD